MMLIYKSYANNANCEYSQSVDWHFIRILASLFLHFKQFLWVSCYNLVFKIGRNNLDGHVF